MILAVINPVCGDSSAVAFFNSHVARALPSDTLVTTDRNVSALISARKPLTVVLASGDGTLHDILNGLATATADPQHLDFVLIPCGTANALYASLCHPAHDRLRSLQAFLDQSTPPMPISLASATFSGAERAVIAAVVVSTSLHAAILRDSEALRELHPGLDRFRIAAQQNSSNWYNAHVRLLPCPSTGTVQVYDHTSRAFCDLQQTTVHLDGPFAYFLCTFNVDRLEPSFTVAPLVRSLPSAHPHTCDLVVIRPLRDPSISDHSPDARSAFAPKLFQVLTAAYQDGAHIHLAYSPMDGIISPDAQGPAVVEYFRCSAWEWTPLSTDPDAHLVCTDGAISTIPTQGKLSCAIDTFKHHYCVYGATPNL